MGCGKVKRDKVKQNERALLDDSYYRRKIKTYFKWENLIFMLFFLVDFIQSSLLIVLVTVYIWMPRNRVYECPTGNFPITLMFSGIVDNFLSVCQLLDCFFPEDIIERVETIIHHFTFILYSNVCRSLFERHKLLFAFLMCVRILLDKGSIRQTEFNFLLMGAKIEEVFSVYNIFSLCVPPAPLLKTYVLGLKIRS